MKPIAFASILLLAFSATTLAQNPPPPTARDDGWDAVRKLSKKERRDLIARLEVKHQDFLTDVEPIILPAEIDAFLSLEGDPQRDSFVDEFWRRRDAIHRGPLGFREVYYRRLEIAREQFRRIDTDLAKAFLLQGPPNAVVKTDCLRLLQPIEIWKYDHLPALGHNVSLLFFKPRHTNQYRLWNPLGGTLAMSDLLAGDSISAAEARPDRTPQSASPYSYVNRIQLECRDGDEIMRAINSMVQGRVDLLKVLEPPPLGEDEVKKILRSMVIANPEARKLTTDFTVRYPGKEGSRTDVQMTLMVPRSEVAPAVVGQSEVYSIDVTGEVLKEGALWEKYRYRFDFPGDFSGEAFPIVIDRLLRPGKFRSRIKLIDAHSGAEAIVEHDLTVPEIFSAEPLHAVAPSAPSPARAATAPPAQPVPVADVAPRLRLIPPPESIVTGIRTIETFIRGAAVKAVEFWLDGRKMAVRRSRPFALDLDFGDIPRARRVKAVALDEKGVELTGDEIVVNAGTDPFKVRIVSPRIAPHLKGDARIEMAVSIPDGKELAGLDLYWNDTRMARLHDPPFVQTITIPETEGVGYLRAVATLTDGSLPPVEDVVMINTPAYMEELEVHLIELPTTVIVNGQPASNLTEKSFRIFDDGKPVTLSKFDYVRNLPLSIGIAMDTSGSMSPHMEEAQKTGAQFFEKVMRKGDKAFVVAFSEEPEMVQRWSPRMTDLHAALAKLRSEDKTALYDAVVFSLYNFQGVRGQRALVLISDGKDTASKFTFEHTLEYARRAAVPIYAIGLGIPGTEVDVRYKLSKLCGETGGTVYYIEKVRDLRRVYDVIESELRSQYVLGFYPPSDVKAGKWREIKVEVSEGKAKTIKGYFP